MKIKYIEQYDEKDCGPTCLAMISRYYGKKVSVSKLREYCETDLYGTNLFGMIKACQKIGFNAEGFQVEKYDELLSVTSPFIAHIFNEKGFDHFVVIEKVEQDELIMVDPAKGRSTIKQEDFLKYWTNIILTIEKNSEFTKESREPSVSNFFLMILKKNYIHLIFILFCSIVISGISIAGAFYFKILVDNIIPANFLENLHNLSIGILVLYVCYLISTYLRYFLVLNMGLKINKTLMMDYYKHILNLPKKFFDTRKDGEILSRFRDTDIIREAFSSVTVTLIMDVLMIFVGTVILFSQSPKLFLIVVILLPIYASVILFFKKPFEKYNRQEMEANAEVSSKFIEGIRGIDAIKGNIAENKYFAKVKKEFDNLIQKAYKLGTYTNIQMSIKEFLNLFTTLIILWIGSSMVMNKQLSLGELLTFNALVVYYFSPIEHLLQSQHTIQSAIVATKRVNEILDLDTEIEKDKYDLKDINSIVFKSLSFSYGYRKEVLKNINFEIKDDECIALIGESGSGKSTIANLILKYYSTNNNHIFFNNIDINKISNNSLRNIIGYVPQTTYIFFGTVMENLILGVGYMPSRNEIIKACKIAQAHEFILDLPHGYETMLENNGDNLSGGQKQRIEIARAILKNPKLLLLDEPTSSLDSTTSKLVIENLKEINCPKLVITHDLNLVKNFDKLIVLDKGEIKEIGTHSQLLSINGLYSDLWSIQNK